MGIKWKRLSAQEASRGLKIKGRQNTLLLDLPRFWSNFRPVAMMCTGSLWWYSVVGKTARTMGIILALRACIPEVIPDSRMIIASCSGCS